MDVMNTLLDNAGQTVTLRISKVIPQNTTGPTGLVSTTFR